MGRARVQDPLPLPGVPGTDDRIVVTWPEAQGPIFKHQDRTSGLQLIEQIGHLRLQLKSQQTLAPGGGQHLDAQGAVTPGGVCRCRQRLLVDGSAGEAQQSSQRSRTAKLITRGHDIRQVQGRRAAETRIGPLTQGPGLRRLAGCQQHSQPQHDEVAHQRRIERVKGKTLVRPRISVTSRSTKMNTRVPMISMPPAGTDCT